MGVTFLLYSLTMHLTALSSLLLLLLLGTVEEKGREGKGGQFFAGGGHQPSPRVVGTNHHPGL